MTEKMLWRHAVTTTAVLELTEAEMGALDALAGYGTDPFLKSFYKVMGEAYLSPYEDGLRSLFDRIRQTVPSALSEVRDARRALSESRQRRASAIEAQRAATVQQGAVEDESAAREAGDAQ